MKLTIIFTSRIKQIFPKTLTLSESTFKIKAISLWTEIRNFAYVIIYLQTNIFARRPDCVRSLTLQIPRCYLTLF